MKNFIYSLLISSVFILSACEKDEGKLPNISFNTSAGYLSADANVAKGASFKIGIIASKAEDKDVLKKFNLSKSVNGAAASTVLDKSLSGAEEDNYSYEYSAVADTIVGQKTKYTFTVTNRDGLVNQVALTVTVQ
jgi:hypothetical protein